MPQQARAASAPASNANVTHNPFNATATPHATNSQANLFYQETHPASGNYSNSSSVHSQAAPSYQPQASPTSTVVHQGISAAAPQTNPFAVQQHAASSPVVTPTHTQIIPTVVHQSENVSVPKNHQYQEQQNQQQQTQQQPAQSSAPSGFSGGANHNNSGGNNGNGWNDHNQQQNH